VRAGGRGHTHRSVTAGTRNRTLFREAFHRDRGRMSARPRACARRQRRRPILLLGVLVCGVGDYRNGDCRANPEGDMGSHGVTVSKDREKVLIARLRSKRRIAGVGH
jgi:hypothetical protein